METKGRERKPQNSDAAVVAIKKKLATHKMESNRGSGKNVHLHSLMGLWWLSKLYRECLYIICFLSVLHKKEEIVAPIYVAAFVSVFLRNTTTQKGGKNDKSLILRKHTKHNCARGTREKKRQSGDGNFCAKQYRSFQYNSGTICPVAVYNMS